MKNKPFFVSFIGFILMALPATRSWAENPWSEGVIVPLEGRANPYELNANDFLQSRAQGRLHAQVYPVTVTGALPPYEPVRRLLEEPSLNPIKQFLNSFVRGVAKVNSVNDLTRWLGLKDYPEEPGEGVFEIPFPQGVRPTHQIGFSLIERNGSTGFSISCAACHVGNLFGRPILGLTNRFPRANEFFFRAKKTLPLVSPKGFQAYTGATENETQMIRDLKSALGRVENREPLILGLDTSLAQVSLSLNKRSLDAWATPNREFENRPRPDWLDSHPADSKPAVWWNLKYKNRWLSDGSVVSGNPIFTNILWNEIGRGLDLRVLETWLRDNGKVIQDLATAVFSSEAPRISQFFPAERIDLRRARLGETLFNEHCARCHGVYEKAWSEARADTLSQAEFIRTTRVRYFAKTRVVDVGTDPWRRLGMKSLEKLNELQISRDQGIRIEAQNGYVPPPLVGIWARWPYLHNNSVPSLCALLTRSASRPARYWSGEANDPVRDFDFECNGYPGGSATPARWKTAEHLFETQKQGLSNAGHDEGIFLEEGRELFTPEEKQNLIIFMQTL